MKKPIDPKKISKDLALEKACRDIRLCSHFRNNNDSWPLMRDENGKLSYETTKKAMKKCAERRAMVLKNYEKGEIFEIEGCEYYTF